MLKHAGIVNDSCVETFCRLFGNLILLQLTVKHFTGCAGRRIYHVCPGISGIGNVMIQTDAVCAAYQISGKLSQSFHVACIQTDTQIIDFSRFFCLNLIKVLHVRKLFYFFFQIQIGFDLGEGGIQIIVKSQTRAKTISVWTDVSQDHGRFYPFQGLFQFAHVSLLSQYDSL